MMDRTNRMCNSGHKGMLYMLTQYRMRTRMMSRMFGLDSSDTWRTCMRVL